MMKINRGDTDINKTCDNIQPRRIDFNLNIK